MNRNKTLKDLLSKLRAILGLYLCFIASPLLSQNCSVNANVDYVICNGDSMLLIGSKGGLFSNDSSTIWIQTEGPSAIIINPYSTITQVVGYLPNQVYSFVLKSICSDGTAIQDEIRITVNSATESNAGDDFISCPGSIQLNANQNGTNETGFWSIIGTNNGVSINNTNQNNSNISLNSSKSGVTKLRWTIQNTNGCLSYDDILITNRGGVSPISAGTNQELSPCYSNSRSTTLNSSYGGSGIDGQRGFWTLIDGLTIPTIMNPDSNKTVVKDLFEGTYQFLWTVEGSCASGQSIVQITVPPESDELTTASITNSTQNYCNQTNTIVLTGSIPSNPNEIAEWTQRTNLPAIIENPNSPTTSISNLNGVGPYIFRYTITNQQTGCSNYKEVSIKYTTPPNINITSPQIMILPLDTTRAKISYTVSGGNSTQFAIISTPSGVIDTPIYRTSVSPQIIDSLYQQGQYIIRFKRFTSSGIGSCEESFKDIIIYTSFTPSFSNAGTNQILACNVTNTTIVGNQTTSGKGYWSQIAGPTMVLFADSSQNITDIENLANGAYTFRWSINGGINAPTNYSNVNVYVASSPPTTAYAGNDFFNTCYNSTIQLNGNETAENEFGHWEVFPNNNIQFSNIYNPNSEVWGFSENSTYTFVWTIENACGISKDTILVFTNFIAGNQFAYAGSNQCVPFGTQTIILNATPTNEGVGNWTQISGTPVTINHVNSPTTTVSNLSSGSYLFEWKITQNECSQLSDTVLITISSNPLMSNAGNDTSICGQTVILNGNTSTFGIGTWHQLTGPTTAIFSNIHNPNTDVFNLQDGIYMFDWKISEGACNSNADTVKIAISIPTNIADAGINISICPPDTSIILNANIPINGYGYWSQIEGDNILNFSNITSYNSTLSGFRMGTYKLRWKIQGGVNCPVSHDDIIINYTPKANAGNDISICSREAVCLIGNDNSNGIWSQISGNSNVILNSISTNTAIASGLDTGIYSFRYTILNGCLSSDDVVVKNYQMPNLPNAGLNQNLCNETSVELISNIPEIGVGKWKYSGNSLGSFSPNTISTHVNYSILEPGTHTFTWTITNGACSVSDRVYINNYYKPDTAKAGDDQIVCGLTTNLNANIPIIGIGRWSVISGPGTININYPISPAQSITASAYGTYVLRWSITNGINWCSENISTSDITIQFLNTAPIVPNAGNNFQVCGLNNFDLIGNEVSPAIGYWQFLSGPNEPSISDTLNRFSTISNITFGNYYFTWNAKYDGCLSTDTINISVIQPPSPSLAQNDTSICLYSPLSLIANSPSIGIGKWTQISGPNTSIILSPYSNQSLISGIIPGNYTYKWSITNGNCEPMVDSVHVIIYNLPSIATTVSDFELCQSNETIISANQPNVGTGIWSIVSGPNTPNIINQNSHSTAVQGLINGKYVFKWTISNSICAEKSDSLTVTIYDSPTISNAGLNKIVCGLSTNMNANMPNVGIGSWSQISGPSSSTFSQPHSPNSTVTCSQYGIYKYRWSIKNGDNVCPENISTSDITIQYINKPIINPNAGTDQQLCEANQISLHANNVSPSVGYWKFISGPNYPIIADSLNQNLTLTNLIYGNYTLSWNAKYDGCYSSDSIQFTIYQTPSIALTQDNFEMCLDSTFSLSANNPEVGIGKWIQLNGPNIAQISNVLSNQTNISNAISGNYLFEWKISNGVCPVSIDSIRIRIFENPTVANAGIGQELCNASNFELIGNIPTIGVGSWYYESGPNEPNININGINSINVSNLNFGNYTFRWVISNGICTNSSLVNISNKRKPQLHLILQNSCNVGYIYVTTDSITQQTFSLLDSNNNIIQSWSGCSNNYTFTNVTDGLYFISITRNTCETFSDLINFTNYHNPQTIDTIYASRTTICPNDNGTIIISTDYNGIDSVFWFINDSNSVPFATGNSVTINSPITSTFYLLATHNNCGYSSFKSTFIEVTDLTPPIGEIENRTFETDNGSCYIENIDIGTPITFDNCSDVIITSSQPTTYETGEHDILWNLMDESGNTNEIHQQIKIISKPIAINDTLTAIQNQPNYLNIIINDIDCDHNINVNSLLITNNPEHGIVEIISNTGIIKYTPTNNYYGCDFLSYEICDSTNLCSSANVYININYPLTPPIIHDTIIFIEMNANAELTIPIFDNANYSPYHLSNFACYQNGYATAEIQNQLIIIDYSPTYNYIGLDTICIQICDSNGLCSNGNILISILKPQSDPIIGISEYASEPIITEHGDYIVHFSIIIKNLSTFSLSNVQILDSLENTFTYPINFNVLNLGSKRGTLIVNPNFNGISNYNILNSNNTLEPSESDTIYFDLRIVANQQFGVFFNNAYALATDSLMRQSFDISNNGLIIDSDRNNVCNEIIDNTPTPIEIKPFSQIGLALNLLSTQKMEDQTYRLEFLFTIENIGNYPLKNIQLINNLYNTFQNHEFYINDFTIISGDLIKNSSYNGIDNINMLDTSQSMILNPGDVSYIHFEIGIKNQNEIHEYFKSTTIKAQGYLKKTIYDISNNGFIVDPNHNGIANETDENIPTKITIGESAIWIPEGFSPNGDGLYDYFVIEGYENKIVILKVYNRWGNLVYENDDYKNDWDGKTNKNIENKNLDLPDGTYFYIICTNSCCKPMQGSITIKR